MARPTLTSLPLRAVAACFAVLLGLGLPCAEAQSPPAPNRPSPGVLARPTAPAPALFDARTPRGVLDATLARPTADDKETLYAAMRVLARRGYAGEARRLRVIAAELDGPTQRQRRNAGNLPRRARALLRADVQERATRIEMLDLIADAYDRSGNRDSSAAMRWLAAVGRINEGGNDGELPPMPDSLSRGDAPLMQRLTRIVLAGEEVCRRAGLQDCASVCERLGRFYRAREAGETQPPAVRGPSVAPSVEDLVTIEARVPVLNLAEKAYESLGDLAENDEVVAARDRMRWMAATGRNRVNDEQEELPVAPLVVPDGMDSFIQNLDIAARLWLRRGDQTAAESCRALAEYYRLRSRGEIADESRSGGRDAEPSEEAEEPMMDPAGPEGGQVGGRQEAMARLNALRAEIARLKDEIERLRRKRR